MKPQRREIPTDEFSVLKINTIAIPRHVQFVDGSAFSALSNIEISIDSSNLHFVV
jgi:hypothetical protein